MAIEDYKLTSESTPNQAFPIDIPYQAEWYLSPLSNDFQKRGMSVQESPTLAQTITIPEVQEWSTVRYVHQLRRLAAASTPTDESTSGLRGWQPGGEPEVTPRNLR